MSLSGPEVIETARGVEEFDSRDRALVWRITGGKHRWLSGDCDALVDDDVAAFRAAAIDALVASNPRDARACWRRNTRCSPRACSLLPESAGRRCDAVGASSASRCQRVPDLATPLRACLVATEDLAMNGTLWSHSSFGADHGHRGGRDLLRGYALFDGAAVHGDRHHDHAPIGVRLALTQARAVLDTIAGIPAGRSCC